MEISDLIRLLRTRGWVVIALALLGALSGFVFSRLQTPVYKSTMKLTIQPARPDFGLAQSAKSLISSYIQIIWTEKNAAEIAKRLQLDYTPGTIYGATRMADDLATFGIEIQVTDYNGDTANNIALKWAELMKEYRDQNNASQRREDRVDIVLGDNPRYSQDRPRTSINTIAGGLLGLVTGVGALAIIEALAALRIRSRSDVERRLNLPVLATIPAE